MKDPIHLISLGAGVQSSTMALMAAGGEITPMPKAAIFADTQDEPASVYRWLDWLEARLPFPVHRVTAGKLSAKALERKTTKDGRIYTQTSIPYYTKDFKTGEKGKILGRICTADFKLKPLFKKAKELAGVRRAEKELKAIQWIGISLDEVQRMRVSGMAWTQNRYPLIDLEMTRHDCLRWMESRGFPKPPRSACVFCPFHSDHEWRRLKTEEPEAFEQAAQFAKAHSQNMNSQVYLHKSLKPIREVDFSTDTERGQSLLSGFNNECLGMCGI